MTKKKDKKDLFLCHSSADKEKYIVPIVNALQKDDISYWFDEAEILPGDSIIDKISDGLNKSRYVIPFISRSFLKRNWPQEELHSAIAGSIRSKKNNVIPVLVNIKAETLFKKYPLLRDKKCASLKYGEKILISDLIKILSRDQVKPIGSKFAPKLLSNNQIIKVLDKEKININNWLRIANSSNEHSFLWRSGFDELLKEFELRNIPVQINWDKAPSASKRYIAGVLLSAIIAFEPNKIEGYNQSYAKKNGVYIHSFDRPAYPQKDYDNFFLKAASGCIINDEWWLFLNIPAFFDAGSRDELSMAPIALGKSQKSFTDFSKGETSKFNPWLRYDIDPALVLVPCNGLSKKLKKKLRRFKFAAKFPRVALNPFRFTRADARFLRNNGFMVIDGIINMNDIIAVLTKIIKITGIK